jgi:hypothetical protein
MGKALALAAVAFISLGTYYGAQRSSSEIETRRRVSNGQYETLARNAALAGLNVAKQRISEAAWSGKDARGRHQDGNYTTSIKIQDAKRATIESVGTVRNAGRMSENYAIRVLMDRRLQLPEQPPKFMQYAIATDSDIEFKGNVAVKISSDLSNDMNANVHTNGTLTVSGNAVEINGFGSYSNGASGIHVDNTFDPNYNPTSLPTHYDADPIPIPDFTEVDYLSALDAFGNPMVDNSTTGTTELSGSYDFGGTREDPYVWYIEGDLNITGDTQIDGYVHFVVEGNVDLQGDLTAGDSGYDGASESSIGVTSSGNISLTGDRTVEAQMFAGGDISSGKGTPTLRGSLAAKGKLILAGTPNILFKSASSGLTQFWQNDFKYTYHVVGYNEQ